MTEPTVCMDGCPRTMADTAFKCSIKTSFYVPPTPFPTPQETQTLRVCKLNCPGRPGGPCKWSGGTTGNYVA